jgi:transposase
MQSSRARVDRSFALQGHAWRVPESFAMSSRAPVEPLLPSERGRKSRPSHDNRRFFNGILHVLRVGCPWRDMHERYGKWNSVYVRFRRWATQGVWDALLETLVELGLADDWQHMIDSTTVRGHSQAAGANVWPAPFASDNWMMV